MRPQFDHERLDAYQAAIQFLILVEETVEKLPRGRAYLADQLQRAATSIPLNIAEGAGVYRMALRSATECAALLDVCRVLKLTNGSERGRDLLVRLVAMLTTMARRLG